jgi:hypothetical protein
VNRIISASPDVFYAVNRQLPQGLCIAEVTPAKNFICNDFIRLFEVVDREAIGTRADQST